MIGLLVSMAQLFDEDCRNDDHPDRDGLPVGLDVDNDQSACQNRDDDGTDNRTKDVSSSAKQARAANDHCGDGVQFVVLTGNRRC